MNAVEYSLFLQEFHFRLGRMHIHIHHVCRDIQMQHAGREFTHHDLIAVSLFKGSDHNLGFHRTAIDEESLQIAAGAGIGGLGNIAGQMVILPTAVHGNHPCKFPAIHAVYRCLQVAGAGGGELLLSVPQKGDGNLRVCQCLNLYRSGHTTAFVSIGFHEFHTGGGVEKQIPHDDGGAIRAADFAVVRDYTGFQTQAGAGEAVGGFGHQINAADRCHRCQCFTAEAKGGNGSQILCSTQLGGGMAQKGSAGIISGHAAAIVRDPKKGHAAIFNLNGDLGGAGIHCVFQQFLHHGGGALHHFTCGDEVGNMRG